MIETSDRIHSLCSSSSSSSHYRQRLGAFLLSLASCSFLSLRFKELSSSCDDDYFISHTRRLIQWRASSAKHELSQCEIEQACEHVRLSISLCVCVCICVNTNRLDIGEPCTCWRVMIWVSEFAQLRPNQVGFCRRRQWGLAGKE